MVQVDLSTILKMKPEELQAQDKEDLFENLSNLDLEPNLPPDKVKILFELSKSVLKYKGDQVESLISELDIIASSGDGMVEIREEFVKAKRQNEQLIDQLERKDEQMLKDRYLIDKLSVQVSELEKDKSELENELSGLRDERLASIASQATDDLSENMEHVKEALQNKNKHILQLLTDIEVTERDNEKIRSKLSHLRSELAEATASLTKTSGENITLRETNYQIQEKITVLEDRNTALVNQVSDLVRERNEQDSKLDELIDALESRVAKWQDILSQKDTELADLRSRLDELEASNQNQQFSTYSALSQSLGAHEEKVKELESQLALATTDLQESTRLLQEFKRKAESRDSSEDSEGNMGLVREELEKAHSEINMLEERLKDAELDAQQRAEEMTEMIIQLREYEEGRYGLKEAREEIQELRKQIAARDKQVLRLVDQANQLHMKLGDKITLTPGEMYCSEEGEIPDLLDSNGLRTQLHQVQQTAINLSMQNYDLKAEVIKMKQEMDKEKPAEIKVPETKYLVEDYVQTESDLEKDSSLPTEEPIKTAEERLVEVIEENEALRKGLHEILDSIRGHDGTSSVNIQSECLESLLEALDSRSVSGWYHPAMRLQAALNKMYGTNQELRQQIREARLRESYMQAELQAAVMRVDQLEAELDEFIRMRQELPSEFPREPPKPPPRLRSQTSKPTSGSQDEGGSSNGDHDNGNGNDDDNGSDPPPEAGANPDPTDPEKSQSDREKSERSASIDSQKRDSIKSVESKEHEFADHSVHEVQEELTTVEPPHEIIPGNKGNNDSEETVGVIEEAIEQKCFNDAEVQTDLLLPSRNGSRQSQRSLSGEKSVSPVIKEENEIREKCDQLRSDLESIRTSTDDVLQQMSQSRDELTKEIRDLIQSFEQKMEKADQSEKNIELITAQEAKIIQYEAEINVLKVSLHEKDLDLSSKDVILTDLRKQLSIPKVVADDTQVLALKTTVSSLQNLITKKEEVIERYQKLIQENSEEYNKLMDQYKTLEAHSKRLSSPSHQKLTDSRAITLLMEKWLGRVHGLEDQVCSLAQQLSAANTEIQAAVHECHHWKAIAQKVDEKQSDRLEEVLEERRREIEELRNSIDQIKLEYEMKSKDRVRNEVNKFRKKEDEHKTKMKNLEGEIARLKQHSRSSTYKSSNTTKKEYLLMDKIKSLEEELQAHKLKEQSNMQHRRDRCAEEVSKWEERKRLQGQVEKLKGELRERGALVEALELQVSRLKLIVSRLERERIALQRRLKLSQDNLNKLVLNPGSRDSKATQMEDCMRVFDPAMDNSPIGNTPRSRPGSSNESVTLGEPKSRGRSRQDLERVVVSLKKVVAKLKSENKLYNKDYVEKIQDELKKTQESYVDAVDRNMVLEEKLKETEREITRLRQQTFIVDGSGDRAEAASLREQLHQKCELLSKVKVLLHRAMLREKQLMDQVAILRAIIPADKLIDLDDT